MQNVQRDMWILQIMEMNVGKYTKEVVLRDLIFLTQGKNSTYAFIEIKDPVLAKMLNHIAGHKKIITSLDIEFQSGLFTKQYTDEHGLYSDSTFFGSQNVFFMLELGMIIFIKDLNNQWIYLGYVFVNLPMLSERHSPKYISSTYTTTTKKTEQKMIHNDAHFDINKLYDTMMQTIVAQPIITKNVVAKLQQMFKKNALVQSFLEPRQKEYAIEHIRNLIDKAWNVESDRCNIESIFKRLAQLTRNVMHNIFPNKLKGSKDLEKLHQIYTLQLQIYQQDPSVSSRTISKKDIPLFFSALDNIIDASYLVVKGRRDMLAINNSIKFLVSPDKQIRFDAIYDIEMFNQLSYTYFKSAKLDETFNGLVKKNVYKDHMDSFFKSMFKHMESQFAITAHNPVVDSVYTLIVALVINVGLDEFFSKP